MDKINELKKVLAGAEEDAQAFYTKGNNAAGTRLRKAMQELKVIAQDVRTEVSELKEKAK